MNTQGVDPLEYVSHLCAKLTGWVINVLTMFSDLARRDPGSGLWPKFAALAGSSCGSSRSEAGSHSKAATTSAPTCRPARRHPPHLYCTGGAAVHTSCSFLCCALGAGSCLVLMHTSFCLFCCCCCFAFLFKTFTGRNQGHQTPWWSHRIVFLTVTVKTPFSGIRRMDALKRPPLRWLHYWPLISCRRNKTNSRVSVRKAVFVSSLCLVSFNYVVSYRHAWAVLFCVACWAPSLWKSYQRYMNVVLWRFYRWSDFTRCSRRTRFGNTTSRQWATAIVTMTCWDVFMCAWHHSVKGNMICWAKLTHCLWFDH